MRRQVVPERVVVAFGSPQSSVDCTLARSVLKREENMRARLRSDVGDTPRTGAAVGSPCLPRRASRWAARALAVIAGVLALIGGPGIVGPGVVGPGIASAQTTNNSLTRLSSPNGDISMIPNAQGVERRRDYYTPTRPWWINYEDCLADDEFTFTLTSQVTGDTLEIWAGSENCATNRSLTDMGQCWILAAEPLQADTIEVKVPVRNILARRLNTTVPPTNVSRDVCDDSTDPSGETLTLYFMVVDSGQGKEYFAWDGGDGGVGFDVVGPTPPGRISVGIGENQLTVDLDDIDVDADRQRYEAFCVPEGTTRASLGLDAGASSGSSDGSNPSSSATDAGSDGGLDASTGGSALDAGSEDDPNAAPRGCFTDVLRKGERPPPEFSCGEANSVSRSLSTGRLANNQNYAVAVAGQDSLGNAGVASEIQCGKPIPLDDFYELYSNGGGPGGGGFCNLSPGQQRSAGALGAATLALALAGFGWRRRKGRA
jgi:hypothetical protein